MTDPRVSEHAKILVNYCCNVQPGDYVAVSAWGADCLPLIQSIAAEVAVKEAFMLVTLEDPTVIRAYLLNADVGTLETLPTQLRTLAEGMDARIEIWADANTQEMQDVPPSKISAWRKSIAEIMPITHRKKWNVTLHPTQGLAQEARKSFEAYSDFVYKAMLRDWKMMAEEMHVLADMMSNAKRVRITGKQTDISFSIEGRKSLVDDGKHNLPGGEAYTSPDEDSVNGKVYFDLPINYLGGDMRGIRLVFKNGLITEHSAEIGNSLLGELLSTDEGARRLGELGIGMNRGVTEPSGSILFDEKMGDTIHLAVGNAYEEAGGKNTSGIHIDMIKDMKEGVIYFDDKPIYKEGKFVWE
jgi:aminopeptidase